MGSLFTDFKMNKNEKIKTGMFIGIGLFFILSNLYLVHGDLLVAILCGIAAAISISLTMVYRLLISVKHLKDDNDLK